MNDRYKNSKANQFTGVAVLFLILFITITSCEKEVDIKLDSGEPKLVVEGAIETGLPPYVILTKSIGYFATIDMETLQNSFVHDAKVTVSDGIVTVPLVEYNIDSGEYKFSVYSVENLLNPPIVGSINTSYKLTIEHNGKVYEATTTIPNPKPVDSIWARGLSQNSSLGDSARRLFVAFTDPDTIGNNYRYFTQKNSEPYYPAYNSVYEDQIFNGSRFDSLSIDMGGARTRYSDSTGIAFVGDTVTLKWCAIDKQVFQFFSTYEYALGTIGSPFATPIKVKTNISNGALGIWAGYGSSYRTLYIK